MPPKVAHERLPIAAADVMVSAVDAALPGQLAFPADATGQVDVLERDCLAPYL